MAKSSKKATQEPVPNPVVEDIPHEIIVPNNGEFPTEVVPSLYSIEKRTQNEIARFGKADAGIKNLEKKYDNLPAIIDANDTKGYKEWYAAWQEVRNVRISFEKTHKIVKADYVFIGKAIDGEKNRLVAAISPLEEKLGNELERIDNLKKAEKEKAEREAQERLQGRVSSLIENGILFNGSYYTIGDSITMDVVTLSSMTDEVFTDLLRRVQSENEKIKEQEHIRLENEQREREALAKQKADQEAKEKELRDQQEALRRQQEEMKTSLRNSRIEVFESMGFVYSHRYSNWTYNTTGFSNMVEWLENKDLADLTQTEWAKSVTDAKDLKSALEKMQADSDKKEKERAVLQNLRLSLLQPYAGYGQSYNAATICDLSEDDFINLLESKKPPTIMM